MAKFPIGISPLQQLHPPARCRPDDDAMPPPV